MKSPYFDLTCKPCCAHFTQICIEEDIVAAAMVFATAAVDCRLSPLQAIKGYFDGYHAAGHPADPQRISEPERVRQLFGDDEGTPRLSVGIETVVRGGVRMVPHPFDHFQDNDLGSFCGHGMESGDFCSLSASDLIHSFRCPDCRQRGWIWTDTGEPHCGYCHAGGAPCG